MSRSGDFRGDNRRTDGWTDKPIIPVHACGVNIGAARSHILPNRSECPVTLCLIPSQVANETMLKQRIRRLFPLTFGVKHFHSNLYGWHFTFVTDHKPLTAFLGPEKGFPPLAVARLQRWAWTLSAYI